MHMREPRREGRARRGEAKLFMASLPPTRSEPPGSYQVREVANSESRPRATPREENGGYECEFVEPPPKQLQSECSICLLILRNPHMVSCCGHSFCEVCIGRIQRDGNPCPLCNEPCFTTMANKSLKRTLNEFQVRCPHRELGCEWVSELGKFDQHLCLLTVVECDFHYAGCGVKLPRKDMAVHMKEESMAHISLLAAENRRLAKQLQINSQELRLQQAAHQELAKKVASLTLQILPVNLKMAGFKKLRSKNSTWYSPPFYTHVFGYKMCLMVDANGHGGGKGTHVSVSTCLMCGEFDSHAMWPFRGDITIQLLNQLEDREHCTHTFRYTDETPDDTASVIAGSTYSCGWGTHQFIPHSQLNFSRAKNCHYLKDDCLIFRVLSVKVR